MVAYDDYDHNKRRNYAMMCGWLKINNFASRGYGIIERDDGKGELFCHLRAFRGYQHRINDEGIYKLEYRRRLSFRLAFDAKSDRAVAADVTPIRELMSPEGKVIPLPPADRTKAFAEAERAEAERVAKLQKPRTAFGSLVDSLR
jgi:cold shock CspA family protein